MRRKRSRTLYDPGIGTALLMHWPHHIEGGQGYSQLVSNIDVCPTLLDIAGIPIPGGVSGKSFAPLLLKQEYIPRNYIYAEMTYHNHGLNAMRAIRTRNWKYIRNFTPFPVQFELPEDFCDVASGQDYRHAHRSMPRRE